MGIPAGAELHFVDGELSVFVASERKVMLRGELTSLTAATRELLGLSYSVQPTPYWSFEGRLLSEIYEETYSPA